MEKGQFTCKQMECCWNGESKCSLIVQALNQANQGGFPNKELSGSNGPFWSSAWMLYVQKTLQEAKVANCSQTGQLNCFLEDITTTKIQNGTLIPNFPDCLNYECGAYSDHCLIAGSLKGQAKNGGDIALGLTADGQKLWDKNIWGRFSKGQIKTAEETYDCAALRQLAAFAMLITRTIEIQGKFINTSRQP